MRAGGAGLIAVALLLTGVAAPAAAQRVTRPCEDGSGARCGSLPVPLYRGAPHGGGGKLRIHFRVYPRTDRSRPALEPIVAVEGGPGYPSIESAVCARLGLQPAPVSSQIIARDRHAELLTSLAICAASLETFALEIRGLQKTEIGEVEEPFAKGQKGSSAMPHKRNPIGCEQIVGLARLVRANAMAALENVALWHERDISHSSVERVILPDSFAALDHMLRRFTKIADGMVVYPERMRENMNRSRGVVFSGTILLELARRGLSRERAYELVQRNAMRAFHEQTDFQALLLADADVTDVLSPAEIATAFDLGVQLRNVSAVMDRVFAEAAVPAAV